MYVSLLKYSLEQTPSNRSLASCNDGITDVCQEASVALEVLWPLIFGEALPFVGGKVGDVIRAKRMWENFEAGLPTEVLQSYRSGACMQRRHQHQRQL